jgi:hypothetical protein
MNRHATLDELANLGADNLRPRKAARVNRHVATCAKCSEVSDQLSSVPAVLSSVPFPQMPASLSVSAWPPSLPLRPPAEICPPGPGAVGPGQGLPGTGLADLPGRCRFRPPG